MDISKIYELLVDSLIMICSDSTISSDTVEEYLSELEGDYYTFFDRANTMSLYEAKILDMKQVDMVALLKDSINSMPKNVWNPQDFRENAAWEKARKLAEDILKQLGVERRAIE